MFSHVFIAILLLKIVAAQINGEFWWLNENAVKLQQVEPPPPKFDDVNEFETDESVKVVFRDNELYTNKKNPENLTDIESFLGNGEVTTNAIRFQDETEQGRPLSFANDEFNNTNKRNSSILEENTENFKPFNKNKTYFSSTDRAQNNGDVLRFVFPTYNDVSWEDKIKKVNETVTFNGSRSKINNEKINQPGKVFLNDKVWFEEENKQMESESICTFIKKEECKSKNGVIHMPGSCARKVTFEVQRICCILPLASKSLSRTQEPNTFYKNIKRNKRSESSDELRSVLKQRNALLLRNQSQAQKNKLVATTAGTKPAHKIVTPDFVDPYWNIKNSKFRNPASQSSANQDYQNTKYDYNNPDDVDYAVELPKPGLVGLYSENDRTQGQTSWKGKNINKGFSYGGTDEVSEEDSGESNVPFGYSTFDPRLGDRVSTNKPRPLKRKTHRVTTPREEQQTSESQTINFHSTPDFRVLQGFKLINLAGNKNRYIRKTTTERFNEKDEEGLLEQTSLATTLNDDEYVDVFDLDQQVFKRCGRKSSFSQVNSDKDATESGCDPWLAIVVSTKNPESILCYATIVHPRAAVTAADCVQGKSIGEVTLIGGVWDLKQDRENSQHRMATIHVHSHFNNGDLDNNIALLHWKRPLRIDAKVQAACLGDPHVGDSCYFVGWGGFDRALQPRPHWQHATILTPRNCNEKISSPDVNIPAGAFCASVNTRGTVTGTGGPLLCKTGGRISIVGVAVYRESIVVLLPIFEWITTALRELQIH